jgi:predicted transcriptional regulator
MTDSAESLPAEPPKESDVDIHKPHAAKTWKEFFIELGTIVTGILIAISLEQTVEAIHWRHKVDDAAQAMRLELRDADGPQAYTRVALQACLDRQLDGLATAIAAGRSRTEIGALATAYRPPYRTWDTEAWKATLASDVGSHVDAEEMINWSKPYRILPQLEGLNAQEHTDRIALQPAGRLDAQLTQAEADAMLMAVQRLRADNHDMSRFSRYILFSGEKFGASMTGEQQSQLLAQLRAHYQDCVTVPSTAGVNPTDQLRDLRPQ